MRVLALALLFGLQVGCVTTTVTRVDSTEYPETDAYDVELFANEDEVSAPFEVLGVIDIRNYGLASEGDALRKATEKAAAIGANGLVLSTSESGDTGDGSQMLAIRVRYDQSELQRAFTSEGEDVKRIKVKTFEEWVGAEEEEEPPADPEAVRQATELSRGLMFPGNDGRVRYRRSSRLLNVRFGTPADYEIDYDDIFGRLRNNQWIVLNQFDEHEVPVDKVVVETNDLNGRGFLRAVTTAEDVRQFARLPRPEPWRAVTQMFVRMAPQADWVLLDQ